MSATNVLTVVYGEGGYDPDAPSANVSEAYYEVYEDGICVEVVEAAVDDVGEPVSYEEAVAAAE
jgi:hypothetical protein